MSTYVTKKIRNFSFLISVLIFLKSKQKIYQRNKLRDAQKRLRYNEIQNCFNRKIAKVLSATIYDRRLFLLFCSNSVIYSHNSNNLRTL